MERWRAMSPGDRFEVVARLIESIAPDVSVWVGAAADQVLRKLDWFRLGGEVSDRQWRDVLSILRVQGDRIDREQLLADAEPLGLADLVTRALEEEGGRQLGSSDSTG